MTGFLSRIIIAFAFMLMACNAVFASSPFTVFCLEEPPTQPPWNIGATSEDNVFVEFSPDGTLIIIGNGNTMAAISQCYTRPWESKCRGKNIKVVIEKGVTSIGNWVFACESLETIIVAPDNNSYSSKDGVLYDKNFSTLINYPGGKSGIAIIPDGVTSIGNNAFYNSNLDSIVIPNSVTSIGNNAFYNYKKLTSITILNPTPPSLDYYIAEDNTIIYVPKGSIDAYRQADGWKDFKNIKPIE